MKKKGFLFLLINFYLHFFLFKRTKIYQKKNLLLLNRKKRKKFSKKYFLLENSIVHFVNWRVKKIDNKDSYRNLLVEKIRLNDMEIFSDSSNKEYLFSTNSKFPNKNSFLTKYFELNPSSFFPQKKNFMQYWIFPLIGFVGLTWNKNSNILETIPFKRNCFISDISRIDSILINKNIQRTQKIHEISDSIKSSFTFPIVDSKVENTKTKFNFNKFENDFNAKSTKKTQTKNQKNLYEYYFIAKSELEQKLDLLEKNEQEFFLQLLSQIPQTYKNEIPKKTFSFDIFNTFANSFLWSKNLCFENHFLFQNRKFVFENKKNNLLRTSLNFYEDFLYNKENNKTKKDPILDLTKIIQHQQILNEKTPKKLFPISINYTDFNKNVLKKNKNESQNKMKRNTVFSIIEIPKTFLIKKTNLSNQPIYSYEKAKILLDNAIKNSILTSFSSNDKNTISSSSLDELKTQSLLGNKNQKKSKLLLNFCLLKNNKKNQFILLELKNLWFEQKILKNANKLKFNQFLYYPFSKISNVHLNEKNLFSKSITERLKFDLDKFFISKKLHMNLNNKMNFNHQFFIKKSDKNMKIHDFSNSNLKIQNKILTKLQK